MPFFADSDQLYAVARSLLTRVQEKEPEATAGISSSHLVIRLKTNNPKEIVEALKKMGLSVTYSMTTKWSAA